MEEYASEQEQIDYERIKDGDYLFSLGIDITPLLEELLKQDTEGLTISPLKEGEEIEYEGKLEDLRVMCKNEEMSLCAIKYVIPLDNEKRENYHVLSHYIVVLVKEIDIEDESSLMHKIKFQEQVLITLRKITDYFEMGRPPLCFYLYFPENIIIDNDGNKLCKIEAQTEWEHHEEFGEHKD